jgi:hypothetical protein
MSLVVDVGQRPKQTQVASKHKSQHIQKGIIKQMPVKQQFHPNQRLVQKSVQFSNNSTTQQQQNVVSSKMHHHAQPKQQHQHHQHHGEGNEGEGTKIMPGIVKSHHHKSKGDQSQFQNLMQQPKIQVQTSSIYPQGNNTEPLPINPEYYQQQQQQQKEQVPIPKQQPVGNVFSKNSEDHMMHKLLKDYLLKGKSGHTHQIIMPRLEGYEPDEERGLDIYMDDKGFNILNKGESHRLDDVIGTTFDSEKDRHDGKYVVKKCCVHMHNNFMTKYVGVEIVGAVSQLPKSSPFKLKDRDVTFVLQPNSEYKTEVVFWNLHSPESEEYYNLVHLWDIKKICTAKVPSSTDEGDPKLVKGKIRIDKNTHLTKWISYFKHILSEDGQYPEEKWDSWPLVFGRKEYDALVSKIDNLVECIKQKKMESLNIRYHVYDGDHKNKNLEREKVKYLDSKVDKEVIPLLLVSGTMKVKAGLF